MYLLLLPNDRPRTHPHAQMQWPRRDMPLCPQETSSTQVPMDQVDSKSYGRMCHTIGQANHQHESALQVTTTESQERWTTLLQVQERSTGLLLTHSRPDYYLGKCDFQNATRK